MLQTIPQFHRDSVEQCWEHFAGLLQRKMPLGTRGVADLRRPLTEFCGVNDGTVRRWFTQNKDDQYILPVGEILLRLMCYLCLHGYKIIEFERLRTSTRYMAELIGFQVLTAQQVIDHLQYAQPSTLYDVIRKNQDVSETTAQRMRSLWKQHRTELEEKKKRSFETCRINLSEQTPNHSSRPSLFSIPIVETASPRTAAVSIMHGLLGLFNQGVFDNLNEEGYESLSRDASMIIDLSSRLSGLSSKLMTATVRKG